MLELEKYGEIVCERETWAVGGDYGDWTSSVAAPKTTQSSLAIIIINSQVPLWIISGLSGSTLDNTARKQQINN